MDKKGEIVYIGNFLYPDGNAAAHRVVSNGRLFRLLGYKTTFIGLDKNTKNTDSLKKTQIIYDDFEGYSIPYPNGIKGWLSYKTQFRKVKCFL